MFEGSISAAKAGKTYAGPRVLVRNGDNEMLPRKSQSLNCMNTFALGESDTYYSCIRILLEEYGMISLSED